jgi:predicted RNA-binding protein associated with RNAse of E/G family
MATRDTVTVHKYTYRGEFSASWQGEVLERTPGHVLLKATWTRDPTPVECLVFEPGDIFLEYYYPQRPYSIWGVYTPEATVKGWYCNVCVPVDVNAAVFEVRDLLLDVLVYPDGSHAILDEDEFAAARADDLPPNLAITAEEAVQAILDLVARREVPFQGLERRGEQAVLPGAWSGWQSP